MADKPAHMSWPTHAQMALPYSVTAEKMRKLARDNSPNPEILKALIKEANDLILAAAGRGEFSVNMPETMWKDWKRHQTGLVDLSRAPGIMFVKYFNARGFRVSSSFRVRENSHHAVEISWETPVDGENENGE